DRFRATPGAVLFATSSFWQGVDVQGEQLSLVIVDKLPFAPPNDPVTAARIRSLKQQGRDAFHEFQVPEAVLALKQGFGRLIRSSSDRGVVALLDSRVRSKAYGRHFLGSLPAFCRAETIESVRQFFAAQSFPDPRARALNPRTLPLWPAACFSACRRPSMRMTHARFIAACAFIAAISAGAQQ